MRDAIKAFILNFIDLDQYLRITGRSKSPFKPGVNQININFFFILLSKKLKDISFIQIGANDGVRNDPIFFYVKKYNWKGVLVEPLPTMFEELTRNYRGEKTITLENVGISDRNGEMDFYFLPSEFNDPDWLQQIGTFDRDAIEFNLASFPDLKNKIEIKRIKTITLAELLTRNRISKFELLIIDVEGFEYRILSQLGELIEKPSYILFEWGCMNEETQNRLFEFLQVMDYRLYSSGGDILAAHNQHQPNKA